MNEIEHERQLVSEWDTQAAELESLAEDVEALEAENAQLKARIAELEAQVPPAALLWSDDFHEQPVETPGQYAIDAPPGSISRVNQGSEPPMLLCHIDFDQPLNHAKKCKVQLGPRLGEVLEIPGRLEFRKKYTLELGLWVPFDWKRDGSKCAIMSFHGTEDPGESGLGRNGCLGFHIVGDRLFMWRCWSEDPIQEGNENRVQDWTVPYVRGAWHDFKVEARFDWLDAADGGVGYTKVTMNDVVLSEVAAPNCFNDQRGPYFQFGPYEPRWGEPEKLGLPRPSPSEHDMGFRRLRLWKEG